MCAYVHVCVYVCVYVCVCVFLCLCVHVLACVRVYTLPSPAGRQSTQPSHHAANVHCIELELVAGHLTARCGRHLHSGKYSCDG